MDLIRRPRRLAARLIPFLGHAAARQPGAQAGPARDLSRQDGLILGLYDAAQNGDIWTSRVPNGRKRPAPHQQRLKPRLRCVFSASVGMRAGSVGKLSNQGGGGCYNAARKARERCSPTPYPRTRHTASC